MTLGKVVGRHGLDGRNGGKILGELFVNFGTDGASGVFLFV